MSEPLFFLQTLLEAHADPRRAPAMRAYMRDQFEFLGIAAPLRKQLTRTWISEQSFPKKVINPDLIEEMWALPEREYDYAAIELLIKYIRYAPPEQTELHEFLITHRSWWDTVDTIAAHLVGTQFRRYPEQIPVYVEKWMESDNLWLQRTCLLFQLFYKKDTDWDLLCDLIRRLNVVASEPLAPLASREALKLIHKKEMPRD
jgi:3-methyladenine DNA glycosylase AlkD